MTHRRPPHRTSTHASRGVLLALQRIEQRKDVAMVRVRREDAARSLQRVEELAIDEEVDFGKCALLR